ncbi:ParA family protein [[Ruminococcus] torques]|uniref:ParA family protein n=1 Tax=[Ruminococcus] torques TaxID=33039 RepID=UPI0027BA83DF|nr:ParA family protein [[Ruminococcus] torques]
MKIIAVVCEKGGTGKSVIAAELYESYVRQGLRTSLYSLDGQYADTSRSKKVDDAEVAVVDTPGVLTDNLKDIVEGADVVVIPVRPTPNDIEPFTRTVSIVAKNTKAPIVIVVSALAGLPFEHKVLKK